MYNRNNEIKFESSMLKSSLCAYSDTYILVSQTITIDGAEADGNGKPLDEINKWVILKNDASFIDCISDISNTPIDNAKDLDVVMPMHNWVEYSNNYLKTAGCLWQYYRDDPSDNIVHSESFKLKINKTGETPADGNSKDVQIAVPLKYLRNFWRTREMPLIICEINLILTCFENCVIFSAAADTKFAITDTILYAPVIILSTQDNAKLLEQLRCGFKWTINLNKFKPKVSTKRKN